MQGIRQSKYYMEIGDIEEFTFPCCNPMDSFMSLALRAMAIATGVIADPEMTT
jgi:hypothetical protein